MKLMAAVVLACGWLAVPLTVGVAEATPPPNYCDGVGCVPYVNHDAALGEHCRQTTRWNFGIDAAGDTLACGSRGQWIASAPLVGIRPLRWPCGQETGVAVTPDGLPLSCLGGAWSTDYRAPYFG